MAYTIHQIAAALGMEAAGDTGLMVEGLAEPAGASARQLALASRPDYAGQLAEGQARAALVWAGADWRALGLEAAIFAPRPRVAMAGLTAMFDPGQGEAPGIHPSAVVAADARLGAGVGIGPLAVVGAGAEIGAGTSLGAHCTIGAGARIGRDGRLREGVRIGARVMIGDRFIAQPGAVVGGDGFSFVTAEVSDVEKARQTLGDRGAARPQSWLRIHSLGAVEIGDDVEIGANATIDSGTIRPTRIGDGSKIDNLVMVGHNVEIGRDCLLCGHVGIAGSVRIGNNVVMGGKTGVSDNVFIGDNVITGGGTIVLANIPAGRVMLGYPAMKMETTMELFKGFRRLKRLFGDVAELKKTVSNRPPND